MPLAVGTRLGPYEITDTLGAGGMGEVYRARDTKLQRDVAIKVLPEVFAADPDRLARFAREAQVLATLNHPNIGAIHGFQESDSVQALVLELVEGPTLADRIAQGAIPIDEAFPIARQIAEALQAAHEQGVIHRDLRGRRIGGRRSTWSKRRRISSRRPLTILRRSASPSTLASSEAIRSSVVGMFVPQLRPCRGPI
jgi:serine/threonine protein kinase